MQNKSGLIPAPSRLRNYDYETLSGANIVDLPSSYTIPDKHIPDVHDQGQTSACVMFALAQCAEAHKRKENKEESHYSPYFSYGRKEVRTVPREYQAELGTLHTGPGLCSQQALDGMLKLGFVKENLFDFVEEVPRILELAAERDDLLDECAQMKPKAYASFTGYKTAAKWNAIRKALVETEEPVFVVTHEYFEADVGSHAVIAIGYTDVYKGAAGKWLKIQNSWGKEYHDNGILYMPVQFADEAVTVYWDDVAFPFEDVSESDWFYHTVKSCYYAGFIKGTSETTFDPQDTMKRGDLAVVQSKVLDKVEDAVNTFFKSRRQGGKKVKDIAFAQAGIGRFEDVEPEKYYADAIHHVSANGIMSGVGANRFNPGEPITRAELATVSRRTLELVAEKISNAIYGNVKLDNLDVAKFADVSDAMWYAKEVYAACRYGLMVGQGNNKFAPNKYMTRAEGATVMMKEFELIEKLFAQL